MGKKPVTSNRIRRKSRKKIKHGPSVNKYANLVPKHQKIYDSRNKVYRDLPVKGQPGEVIKTGLRCIFHGRLYELMENITVPEISVIPDMHAAMGRFKLVTLFDP